MKKILLTICAALAAMAGCESGPEITTNRNNMVDDGITTIGQAKDYLQRQLEGDVLVRSTVRLTDADPGGWRVEFTGGSPSTIDLMNGTGATSGLTPKLVVRHNSDGSTTLWLEENDQLVDTRVTLTQPITEQLETAIPPQLDVRRSGDGRLTVWFNDSYGYPDGGWKDTGVYIRAGSGTGDVGELGPILAIIDNEARGVIAVWLNDEEHTSYTFRKFSPAIRFNVMNNQLDVAEGNTARVLLMVSSSEAWIPTGAGEWIDRWELNDPDLPETRAGYVQPCPNCTIESILPSGRGMGEYVVTIRSNKANFNMIDVGDVHALVLNTNTESYPKLVTSTRFIINSLLPPWSANSAVVPPNSSVEICMSQVVREFRQGFVSHPRIGVTDNVTFDWVWADKPGTMTPAGIVTVMEPMTPPGSGLNSRFRVTTGSVEGNVVVAAKVNGVIVWSWHLWVTDYDPDTDFLTYESTGLPRIGAPDAGRAHSFMDRNLGALSNSYTLGTEDYSAFGLLYQWGRKDPLVGHTNVLRGGETTGPPIIYTPAAPEGTQIPFLTTGVTVGVRYSIEHPEAFIYLPNSYTGQWSWNDLSASSMAALWYDHTDVSHQVTKSVYDPCPAGWRLPSNGVLEGFQPSDNPEDVAKNRGHVDTPFGYIPYAGYVEWDGSVVLGVASFAFYTSQKDIPFWFSRWENGMRYVTSGGNQATKNGSNAYSVRCIKE